MNRLRHAPGEPAQEATEIREFRMQRPAQQRSKLQHYVNRVALLGVTGTEVQHCIIYLYPPSGTGAGKVPLQGKSGCPALFVSMVKDQNIQLTIEAARKIQERSRVLVRESSTLI